MSLPLALLLIVLNGIEIHNQDTPTNDTYSLLIVLNGIEMGNDRTANKGMETFNRTKWN